MNECSKWKNAQENEHQSQVTVFKQKNRNSACIWQMTAKNAIAKRGSRQPLTTNSVCCGIRFPQRLKKNLIVNGRLFFQSAKMKLS